MCFLETTFPIPSPPSVPRRLLQSHLTCVPSSGFVPPPLICVCRRPRPAPQLAGGDRGLTATVTFSPLTGSPLEIKSKCQWDSHCHIIRQFSTIEKNGKKEKNKMDCWIFNAHTHTQQKFPPRAARCCPAAIYSSLLIALMALPVSWVFLLARGYALTLHPSSLGLHYWLKRNL